MKISLIIFSIVYLSINIHSQSYVFYTSAGSLIAADISTERYYTIQECWNVWDYAISGDKLFVLSSSYYQNKILCNQEYYERIYYCFLTADNLNALEFMEINVQKPQKIYMSPDNTRLLVRTADRLILLNTKTLCQDTLDIPAEIEIIGWKTKVDFLLQENDKLFLFNVNSNRLEQYLEVEKINGYYINAYKETSDGESLFRIGDKYIQRCYSLATMRNNKISSIYVAQWYSLDYQYLDKDNILILDTKALKDKGHNYYLTLIDSWRNIKVQLNLSNILNLSSTHPRLKLAENTLDSTFVIAVDDMKERYFIKGDYKDLLSENTLTFHKYSIPSYMVDLLKVYELK